MRIKVGIMQPYFLPYIGYWQLINAVDKYVIYDDVNYIKRSWINRNQILIDGEAKRINLQLSGASQNKLIKEINVLDDRQYNRKLLQTLEKSYRGSIYFDNIYPLIENIINQEEKNLAYWLENSIKKICEYLSINTELIISSSIDKNNELKGQSKILEICNILGASEYYNAIGGKQLYSYEDFRSNNIELKFLRTDNIEYKQFNNKYVPNLSIIDVMMFNSVEDIKDILEQYKLL